MSRVNGSVSLGTAANRLANRAKPSQYSASARPCLPPNVVYSTVVEHPAAAATRRIVNACGPSFTRSRLAVSSRARRSASEPRSRALAYAVTAIDHLRYQRSEGVTMLLITGARRQGPCGRRGPRPAGLQSARTKAAIRPKWPVTWLEQPMTASETVRTFLQAAEKRDYD